MGRFSLVLIIALLISSCDRDTPTSSEASPSGKATTVGWNFQNEASGSPIPIWTNKHRKISFNTPPTTDGGTHWYVQFRSRVTHQREGEESQPHERGIFVKVLNGRQEINNFWADVIYTIRAKSYSKHGGQLLGAFESSAKLNWVGRIRTDPCPEGTQHRDGLLNGEPDLVVNENTHTCESIPGPLPSEEKQIPTPVGLITEGEAEDWLGITDEDDRSFAVAKSVSYDKKYAKIFIFLGGSSCPDHYTFREGVYSKPENKDTYRNGCAYAGPGG